MVLVAVMEPVGMARGEGVIRAACMVAPGNDGGCGGGLGL